MSRHSHHWTMADYYALLARRSQAADSVMGGTPIPELPEKTLLEHIRALARRHGWLCYHTHDSRGSEPGFPDVLLCKPGRLIFAEVKRQQGKLTREQAQWLDMLGHTISGVEIYVWRPSDLESVHTILTQR